MNTSDKASSLKLPYTLSFSFVMVIPLDTIKSILIMEDVTMNPNKQ